MNNDHEHFVAVYLERSREVRLAVRLDLEYGGYNDHHGSGTNSHLKWGTAREVPTVITPRLALSKRLPISSESAHWMFASTVLQKMTRTEGVLDDFILFAFLSFALESLSFRINHDFVTDTLLPIGMPVPFVEGGSMRFVTDQPSSRWSRGFRNHSTYIDTFSLDVLVAPVGHACTCRQWWDGSSERTSVRILGHILRREDPSLR